MNVSDLSRDDLRARLASEGVRLSIGPFTVHLQTKLASVAGSLALLYKDYSLGSEGRVADFHTRVEKPWGPRRWWRPQAFFLVDGQNLFEPFPAALAAPLFEWGLNWCVSSRAHQFLILHSAVVAKNGRAILFPAHPGSGKSTLCAGLAHRGYRLLSDEHALLRPEDGNVAPIPRPIALKNESISAIRDFAPGAVLGPTYHDALKGFVTHARAPADAVERASEVARPGAVVFPRFEALAEARLEPVKKAEALMELVDNSVNYSVWGARGFEALASLVDDTPCYAFQYGNLHEAIESLSGIETAS